MEEYIIPFLPGSLPNEDLFRIEMAGITYPDPKYRIERKNSPIMCLEYIIRGKGTLLVNGKHYSAGQGDVYLLAPGTDHLYYSDPEDPWEKIWMNIQGSLCETLIHGYGLANQVVFPDCALYAMFQQFLSICEDRSKPARQIGEQASLFMHELLQKLAARLDSSIQPGHNTGAAWNMKEYIDNHICEKLSLPVLAQTINLSPSQAGRLFKCAYKKTPYEYILARKIDTACLLLKNTGLSVKEIAYRLNFADEHYFCNVFRKRTGKTPGSYRAL